MLKECYCKPTITIPPCYAFKISAEHFHRETNPLQEWSLDTTGPAMSFSKIVTTFNILLALLMGASYSPSVKATQLTSGKWMSASPAKPPCLSCSFQGIQPRERMWISYQKQIKQKKSRWLHDQAATEAKQDKLCITLTS